MSARYLYAHAELRTGAAYIIKCPWPGCRSRRRGRKGEPRSFAHIHGAGYGWAVPHCIEGEGLDGSGEYYLGPDPARQGEELFPPEGVLGWKP